MIFGRNDSGKSNVLRALNLFFNDETNPGQLFNFDRDFCHARRAEAVPERDIRKFAYVKIWFSPPRSYRASLGEEFWVKKQWSITREFDPTWDNSINEDRLQQYVTRFLNRIHFHYIPAIKDRGIFEHLLAKIYSAIAGDSNFSTSLTGFSTALQEHTHALTDGLFNGLGINSIISPPNDLTDLFRSLDFETNAENGDTYSLTLQRGDGIQVRHIPAILAFLSDRRSEDFHIWGFEEPENSLELANAIEEANLFRQYGNAANKQIFLTSHSPAFFALTNSDVSRYFVSRSEEHNNRLASKLHQISNDDEDTPGDLMGETPHLPVISSYLRQADAQIQQLRGTSQQLMTELSERNRTVVFVEGESDKLILGAAWDVLLGTPRTFDFESATGTTKMESLSKDGKILSCVAPNRKILAIVDNDFEGRELYKNSRLNPGGRWVRHNSNGVHWCRLPFLDEFRNFMRSTLVDEAFWPGALENIFSVALREDAARDNVYKISTTPHSELLDASRYPLISRFLASQERYFIFSVEPESKIPFAEWIVLRARDNPGILELLRPIVEGIRQITEPN